MESYCLDLLANLDLLSESDKEKVSKEANDGLKWLETNPGATKKQIDEKKLKVEKVCSPIMTNIYTRSNSWNAPVGK